MTKYNPRFLKFVPRPANAPASELARAESVYIHGLPGQGGAAEPTKWADITGKPTTFAPAAHAATLVNVTADATNGVTAGNVQVVISALAARIKALEDAAA